MKKCLPIVFTLAATLTVCAEKMKYDLSRHPYFTEWKNPSNGVVSYILTKRVAPVQYPFYFTNPSISPDGKYLWFHAAHYPNPQPVLGCVSLDPDDPWIKIYHHAAFSGESPMVSPDSKGVYFACRDKVYYMDLSGELKVIAALPETYINNRHLYNLVTHLSLSCDGKYFLLDGHVGNVYFVAKADVKTGEVTILHEFDYCHDHGQFSPVDPERFLLARDWRRDPVTGRYVFMEIRLWMMDLRQTIYRPLCPDFWESHDGDTAHEWWGKDGKVYFVNYAKGVFKVDPDTRKLEHIWKRPVCHAQSDSTVNYFCADQTPYAWKTEPVKILFFDRKNNVEKEIVSAMPAPPVDRGFYHLDPHPHFSPDDTAVVYMTTVLGKADVAVTPTDQLK